MSILTSNLLAHAASSLYPTSLSTPRATPTSAANQGRGQRSRWPFTATLHSDVIRCTFGASQTPAVTSRFFTLKWDPPVLESDTQTLPTPKMIHIFWVFSLVFPKIYAVLWNVCKNNFPIIFVLQNFHLKLDRFFDKKMQTRNLEEYSKNMKKNAACRSLGRTRFDMGILGIENMLWIIRLAKKQIE